MKHKSLKLFAIAAMACMTFGALASCGGESAPESTPVSDVAEDVGLTISETTLSVSINKQKTLTASTKDDSKYLLTISYQNVGNNTALLTDFDATMIKYTRSISGMTSGVL